ncbi:MAG: methionyl-tRNA formyltransferase [Syntrophobacterales bacterium]|nr:methionyl-tRNA formyltransferase [Syntrophobacterales bacterium]
MRLVIIGQAPFGRECLQALVNQGEEIVGAITVPDVPGAKKPNPFKELALELNIPLIQPKNLKNKELYEWVKDKRPDLLVLVFVTQFVSKEIIDLATYGGINYHPSILPKYRGGSAISWALINGEKETGVTIHYIDEGVDTGDIILQESVPIDFGDTTVTLYYNKLFPLGVRLVSEAVKLIKEGRAPRIPQDPRLATFQPALKPEHTVVDWRQMAVSIYNLVRGSVPIPGAITRLKGKDFAIVEASVQDTDIWEKPPRLPGEVLDVSEDGILVQAGLGSLLIRKIQSKETGKVNAADFAKTSDIKKGDLFESLVPRV